MNNSSKTLFHIILFSAILFSSCVASIEKNQETSPKFNAEETKLVRAAISDYVEGLYLVDSTRIDKSVDTKMRKIGYWYNTKEKKYRDNLEMTHTQLSNLAARWNANHDQADDNSIKKIEIFDVNSKTASAKLTAVWGIDLFHLAKVNNEWKIVNVMWQSQPEND